MKLSEFLKEVDGTEEDIINYSGEEALEAVRENGYALQYVQYQTPEICLEAVRENGLALQYVHNQTPEICLEAVKKDGHALQYVQDQTPEICLAAVKQNGYALSYVDKSIFDEETVTIELTQEQLDKIKHLI